MSKKLTTEEFKENFIRKYGSKYNLDKVEYINSKTKICVICPIHGDFFIRPNDLMGGYGCPDCGGTKKLTTEKFIKLASFVHNNYFTYDKVSYINSNTKIIVTCPIHGDFEVKPNNHLSGCNCKKCHAEGIKHKINKLNKVNKSTKKLNFKEFKERYIEKYGEKYILMEESYVDYKTKMKVICKFHGIFEITPQKLMSGRGCSKCAKNYIYSTDEFIKRAIEIHGNKYDYSKVEYVRTHDNIIVTCPIHGDFKITPSNHLKGQGCPICNESLLENEVRVYLKNNNIDFEEQKRFEWLGKQSLDFYIPKYNIAIECQGIQHFEAIKFFGGESGLCKQKERDIKKQKLCNDNGLKLLYYAKKNYECDYELILNPKQILEKIDYESYIK